MSLKKEAGKGFFWVAIERLGQQLLAGISFIVLARFLTPEDFGLVGMLMIFFAVSQSFVDSGMGQALIRQKEITPQDRSTVFWLNLILSLLFYALLYFSAPLIADFFSQPELTALTRFMGLAVLFNGMAIVQRSELTQRLEFKKQTHAQIPALLIAAVVSIIMAYNDYGVWALATQFVLTSFFSSLLLWILSPTKILAKWSKDSFFRLFNFGYKLLLSGLLDTTFQHIYKLVIGKFFVPSTLGFYSQAQKLQQLASQSLVGIIQKVSYPILSKTNDDPTRLKRGFRQVIQSSSFVIFPIILILMLLAEPIMHFVLGEQWIPAAPFLQILGLSGMLYHLHSINLNILQVVGRSDLFLRLEIIKKVNISLAIAIGLQFGIFGLLIGQVISSYLALIINTYYTGRFLNYSVGQQFIDVIRVFLISIPMVAIIALIQFYYPLNSLLMLIGYLALAVSIYFLTNLVYQTEVRDLILSVLVSHMPNKFKTLFNI